jgi:hypothetical protein
MSLLDHPDARAILADAVLTPQAVRGCDDRIRPVKSVLDARATPAQDGPLAAPGVSPRPRSAAPTSGRSPTAGRSPSGSPARP